MKKSNKVRFIRHQLRRQRKELRRKKIRKEKLKSRILLIDRMTSAYEQYLMNNRGATHIQKRRAIEKIESNERYKYYTRVRAPEKFSFLHNTNEVLKFVSKLEKCLDKRQKTFVVFDKVVEMHQDAMVVLLSILQRFKENRIDFSGNFPENEEARNVLLNSHFFERIYGKSLKERWKNPKTNSFIHTRTNKKVDVELADRLITHATSTVWGEPKRCTGIYRILIELMTNTHNHAEIGRKGGEYWHLCVVHLEKEKKVIFTFVDYGVGVINSLQNKKPGDKMYDFIKDMFRFLSFQPTNVEVIKEIFLEEKQISSTKESHRGYGLPSLYNSFSEQEIANFNYITNNVHVNAENNDFRSLSENFSGTFIYWELNESCDHLNPLP